MTIEDRKSQAKNIHEAIIEVMNEVGYVQKKRGKDGGISYTYAGEAALIAAIRPEMVISNIYATVTFITDVRREQYTTAKGTVMLNTLTRGVVRFTHAPSQTFIDVHETGEGSDTGDKSSNKALTGLYKYALRQTFCIETGDDPDDHSSNGMQRVTSETKTEQPNATKGISPNVKGQFDAIAKAGKAAGLEMNYEVTAEDTDTTLKERIGFIQGALRKKAGN